MFSVGRIIVGACGTPGSLRALRYAVDLAIGERAVLMPVHAWLPPGGDLADRRYPSEYLRAIWEQAAEQRLRDALELAWGIVSDDVTVRPVVMRGETGPALVDIADQATDVLVVGAGQRGLLARSAGHGRVSRYCMAHASCAVVAVPPAELARETGHGLRGHGMCGYGLRGARLRPRELLAAEAADGTDHRTSGR